MSNNSEVCEATSSYTDDCASLKWAIQGVTMNCLKFRSVITSPIFSSFDSKWVLYFVSAENNYDYEIRLCLYASELERKQVLFKVKLLSKTIRPKSDLWSDHELDHIADVKVGDSFNACWIKRSMLMEKKEELLPDDTLTVLCELRIETKPVTRISKKEPPLHPTDDTSVDKLAADFKNVFEKKKYCDVVLLSSDGQKFPAHKAILEERSSVFAVMFQHDMAESRDGQVRIEDVDGLTLKHLLLYMYTARIDEIPVGVVSTLYVAADKYNMESLKKMCIRQMMSNISLDNVCDAIVLADMFMEERLKESAMSFLHKNASTVIKSDSWKDFVKKNTLLAADILQTVLLSQET